MTMQKEQKIMFECPIITIFAIETKIRIFMSFWGIKSGCEWIPPPHFKSVLVLLPTGVSAQHQDDRQEGVQVAGVS